MRRAASAWKVVQADLLNRESAILRFYDQFRVDQRSFRLQIDRLEHLALHQFEREIDVAMRPAEKDANEAVVDVRIDRPLRTLDRSVVTITGDDIRAGDLHRANGPAEDVGVERHGGGHG